MCDNHCTTEPPFSLVSVSIHLVHLHLSAIAVFYQWGSNSDQRLVPSPAVTAWAEADVQGFVVIPLTGRFWRWRRWRLGRYGLVAAHRGLVGGTATVGHWGHWHTDNKVTHSNIKIIQMWKVEFILNAVSLFIISFTEKKSHYWSVYYFYLTLGSDFVCFFFQHV